MSIILAAENPKNSKIREEIHAFVYKKTSDSVFSKKNVTKSLNCKRCDI